VPRKSNNLPIILIILLAIGGLIGLNVMGQKNDPIVQEKMAKDAEAEAQKKAMASGKQATPPPPPEQAPGANDVAAWGAEKTFGSPSGKPTIVIGWSWTPAVQGDPSSVYNALQAVQKVLPNAMIRVVNLDANSGAAAPGVAVNGKVVVQPSPDGTFPPESAIIPAISQSASPNAGAK
jgi:hypothetical protein